MNTDNPEDLFENFQPQALYTTLCVDGETQDFERSVFRLAGSIPRWRVIFECIFYSKRASLPFKVYLTHVGQNLFCRRSINREYQCEDRYAATFPRERLFPEQLRLAPEGAEINVYIEDCREWDVADRSFLLLPGEAQDYLTPVHIHLYKKEQQDPLRDPSLRAFASGTFSGIAVRCVFDVRQPIKDDRYEIFLHSAIRQGFGFDDSWAKCNRCTTRRRSGPLWRRHCSIGENGRRMTIGWRFCSWAK